MLMVTSKGFSFCAAKLFFWRTHFVAEIFAQSLFKHSDKKKIWISYEIVKKFKNKQARKHLAAFFLLYKYNADAVSLSFFFLLFRKIYNCVKLPILAKRKHLNRAGRAAYCYSITRLNPKFKFRSYLDYFFSGPIQFVLHSNFSASVM